MKQLPPSVWVVVPAYNETRYLSVVLSKIHQFTKQVIIVDDGSSDDTAKIAREHGCVVAQHTLNLGKGAALRTGCQLAFTHLGAEAVVLLDGDDQHDPSLLPKIGELLKKGHHIVFGTRNIGQMPFLRTLGNRLASVTIWAVFGSYFVDIPSGYKAFTKLAYQYIAWDALGYSVEMEIAARAAFHKLPVVTIPIPTIYHDFNRGMTMLDVYLMWFEIITWRFTL